MSELQLRVDAGSRPGGGASQGEIRGPLKYIVRSAHRWGGNGVIPLQRKIKAVLLAKHPDVIARAFGGDADRAGAWIKDAWEKYYGHHPVGKTGAGPTYWRGKGKTVAQQLAQEETVVEITLAGSDLTSQGVSKPATSSAKVPESPNAKEPVACGTMDKGSYFKLPTYGLSLAKPSSVAGVYKHLGQHPTRKTHISAKKLTTGKLEAFHKSQLVVPVPIPRVIENQAAEPSPFGGMNAAMDDPGDRQVTRGKDVTLTKLGADVEVQRFADGGALINHPSGTYLNHPALTEGKWVRAVGSGFGGKPAKDPLAKDELDALHARGVPAENEEISPAAAKPQSTKAKPIHASLLAAYIPMHEAELNLRNVSTEERVALAKKGMAIPVKNDKGEIVNGRYPIAHKGDLKNAITAFGRSGSQTVKAHIAKCAKKLGATSMLPEGWAGA